MTLPPGPGPRRPTSPPVAVAVFSLGGGGGGRGKGVGEGTPRLCARGRILVVDAFGGGAAEVLKRGLDPVDGVSVALRALTAVAELGKPLERGLVLVQGETRDEFADGIVRVLSTRPLSFDRRDARASNEKRNE